VKHTRYQIAEKKDSQALAEFLASEGQLLLPMVELITQAELAVDEVIDVMGRATVEAVLQLSAEQVAGPKQQGRPGDDGRDVRWHGSQNGIVTLSDRKLRVSKPRLRRQDGGEDAGSQGFTVPARFSQPPSHSGQRNLESSLSERKLLHLIFINGDSEKLATHNLSSGDNEG